MTPPRLACRVQTYKVPSEDGGQRPVKVVRCWQGRMMAPHVVVEHGARVRRAARRHLKFGRRLFHRLGPSLIVDSLLQW
jgi:hypothetical protein